MAGPQFKVGDSVQYAHVDARGRSMTIATREAVIVGFSTPTGKYAIVRARNNKKTRVRVENLALAGGPGPVDRIFRGIAEAASARRESPDLTPPPPAR